MLEFNDNDASRQARPSFWIFRGRYAVLVVIGALFFMALFQILSRSGVDFGPTVLISAMPTGLFALWVALFVNGKPDSYTFDLILFGRFKFRQWLFRNGIIQQPPQFNVIPTGTRHPSEYE